MPSQDYLFQVAEAISTGATCPRASVGAILVDKDTKRILATGYNGAASGEPHCVDVGCKMEDGHCQSAIHAELNVIAQAAKYGASVNNTEMYIVIKSNNPTTDILRPCRECWKAMRAAGIVNYQIKSI